MWFNTGGWRGKKRVVQAGSRQHRQRQIIGWALFALVVVLIPFLIADTYSPTIFGNRYTVGLGNLSQAVGLMVAILGLNIATGYSGQLSLGHSFFVGSGAYLTAVLVNDFHWSYVATLGVVVPGLFLFGVLFGIPALRIQGLYLGLLTFAVAAVFPSIIRLEEVSERTGGSNGLLIESDLEAPTWAPLDKVTEWLHAIPGVGSRVPDGLTGRQEEAVYKYFLLVIVALVCFWLVRNILAGRVGRAMVAIRDNPLGAAANGVNLAAYKTLSFGISAAVGGVAGTMLAMHSGFRGARRIRLLDGHSADRGADRGGRGDAARCGGGRAGHPVRAPLVEPDPDAAGHRRGPGGAVRHRHFGRAVDRDHLCAARWGGPRVSKDKVPADAGGAPAAWGLSSTGLYLSL